MVGAITRMSNGNEPNGVEPAQPVRSGARPFLSRFLRSLARREPDGARDATRLLPLCRTLLSERGELSGARVAADLLTAYESLDPVGRDAWFDLLVDRFSPDPATIRRAADAYHDQPSRATLNRLQAAVEAPRQELFRRLNMAPGGTAALVEMRRQLLRTLSDHPQRGVVDDDLAHLFRSWFNRGFLVLQRIDWRTSAVVLERLIQYEAVHQIQGWRDLRRRLEGDRRCYALFHPALREEPLIFIEVALTRGMQANVQPLLDPESRVGDPEQADCALFYSITNCQEGLRGVSFGNFLIKQVVEDLRRSLPRVRTFATLSPIPGFRAWLESADDGQPPVEKSAALSELLARPAIDPAAVPPVVRDEILRLCARYLLQAKRGRAPLDPVARFHLANGARLQHLNWMGDASSAGMRRSLGLTVNYVYRLADLERNHDAYASNYTVVASRDLERLTKPPNGAAKAASAAT